MKEAITVAMEAISENYYKLGEKDERTRILGILEERMNEMWKDVTLPSKSYRILELENLKKLIQDLNSENA